MMGSILKYDLIFQIIINKKTSNIINYFNKMQNSTMNLVKSLEETLSFVSSENAKKDGDLLIVIQSFIQQITASLKGNLDFSKLNHFKLH